MLKKISIGLIWLLAILCHTVPFLFLSHVNAWYGSFLFWLIVGLLIIGLNIIATQSLTEDKLP